MIGRFIEQKGKVIAIIGKVWEGEKESFIIGKLYREEDRKLVRLLAIELQEFIQDNFKLLGKVWKLLAWIVDTKLKWNSCEFYMMEKEVMRDLKISRATYYHWVKSLIEAKILEKRAKNIYRIAPRLLKKLVIKES